MNKLAMYEKGEGKKYLPVSKYYRSDYLGQALIRNAFVVVFGYFLILATVALYFSDYLMNNIHRMDLRLLGMYLLLGFAVLLVFYTVLTYIVYTVKYFRAKRSVKEYYRLLTVLDKMYEREDRHDEDRDKTGGV